MLTDLYQRAYTDVFPTVDCYCGVRVVEERVRKTEPGEWAYRFGVFVTQRYNLNGEPHFCSREDRARALERHRRQAARVWYRMSQPTPARARARSEPDRIGSPGSDRLLGLRLIFEDREYGIAVEEESER